MSVAIEQKEKLASLIRNAVQQIIDDGEFIIDQPVPDIHLEIPRDKTHGDFASNIALVLAKPAKRAPRQVADLIVAYLADQEFIRKVEVAGPGFINFFISSKWLHQVLETIELEGLNYGFTNYGQGEKVLVEFVSANPVGPMNVVNARAAAIGDTVARLMRAAGYKVATEYYVNDAGVQTEVFGRSLAARFRQLTSNDFPFPDDGYPGDYLKDLAQKLAQEPQDFIGMSESELIDFCRTWGINEMIAMQRADLVEFDVEFDRWFREQELHKAGALEQVIGRLEANGYMYSQDGALWFRSTAFGDDKDRVIIKTDGSYTYVTADIAYHYDKLQRGFTKLIDLLGPDHHGYIGRMKAAVQALGYKEDALEVLILQYVALLRNGQQVKMSKRAGEFITLQDLLDEVGKDAARYFFLMRSMESHLDFDLTLAAEQSSDNPVFYIQYAHARICSILQQASEQGLPLIPATEAPLEALDKEAELDLMKKLAELPEEIMTAAIHREPHRIARYALELASVFHSFYTHCHILGEEGEIRTARLTLIFSVRIVLQRVLALLGISAPDRM